MITVDNDSKLLQVKIGGAKTTNELDWNVSYAFGGPGDNAFDGTTNGATPVTLCPGTTLSPTNPNIISYRMVDTVTICNTDTVPQIVTVIYKNGSSSRTLVKINLAIGYTLGYENEEGWYTLDDNGARVNIEISLSGIAIGDTVVGGVANSILYVNSSLELQQLANGLAGVMGLGSETGGHNLVMTGGDSIYDETMQTQIAFDPNGISITTNSGVFETLVGSGAVTLTLRGIQMDDDQLYNYHDTQLVFDSPYYKFSQITTGLVSQLAGFDSAGGLIYLDQTIYPSPAELAYVKGVTSGIQTQINAKAPINNPVFTGSVTLAQNPASALQAATKQYVDQLFLGQDFKEAAKYATIAALPAVVYANGTSGVGATLTGVAFGALGVDSASPIVGDRILVKNQVSTFQNGWYIVTATGSGIAVFVLTRSTDADQTTDFKTGDSSFVVSGTTLSTTTWAYTGIDTPVVGTDAITFAQTGGQGSFVQGNGITITGTTIAVDLSVVVDKTTAQTLTNKTLTSPIFTSPALGTPASGVGTNITGIPAANILAGSFGAGAYVISTSLQVATLELGHATDTTLSRVSAGLIAVEGVTLVDVSTAQTLTNKTLTSPILTTPAIGVATATSLNGITFTTSTGTFTLTNAKTLTVSDSTTLATNSITFAGTEVLTLTATKSVTFADAFITSGAFSLTLVTTATTVATFKAGTFTIADNADLTTHLSQYSLLRTSSGSLTATNTANTYYLTLGGALVNNTSGNAVATVPTAIYIRAADFPSVNGLVPKLKINASVFTNHVAPFTGTITIGLFPITAPASAGGAGLRSHTIGTVVSGSNGAVWTNPTADTNGESGVTSGFVACSDFSLPSDGFYCICVVTSATVAASAFFEILADLQIHYV